MIIEPCKWNIIPSSFVPHALILNEVYEVSLFPYWQEIQFKFYCQVKSIHTGYILELSPFHEVEYPCPHIPITLMTWYGDTKFNFKSSGSYILILDSQDEVESEHNASLFCAILR